jgi:hypothetical protein
MWDASRMRTATIVAMVILLTSCSTPEERRNEAIMVEIEKQVQLPKGALPLNDYARFYADAGRGEVAAVYMLPSVIEKMAAEECEQLTGIDTSKNVPCATSEIGKVKAGERQWVGGHENLPFEVAPGCEVITLGFDSGRRRVVEVGCVGHRPAHY